jgi:MFS family permease
VRRLGGLATIVAGTLTASVGLFLAVAFPRVPVAICGFALVGIGLANVVPVAFSTSVKLVRTAASSIAAVATAGYTSMLAGPPLIGAIANHWSLRAGMSVLAVAALIAAVLAFVMRMNEEKRRRAAYRS